MGASRHLGRGRKRRIHESGLALSGHRFPMTLVRQYLIGAVLTGAAAVSQTVVALDGFHNNESRMPDHYQWDGTRNGGFSQFGQLLKDLGAELRTVTERVTVQTLAGVNIFIIVDPDTPAETDSPKYIKPEEMEAITSGV